MPEPGFQYVHFLDLMPQIRHFFLTFAATAAIPSLSLVSGSRSAFLNESNEPNNAAVTQIVQRILSTVAETSIFFSRNEDRYGLPSTPRSRAHDESANFGKVKPR